MFQVPLWDEVFPTLLLFGVGALALGAGYLLGGGTWRERHSVRIGGKLSPHPYSGLFAEFAVLAMAAGAVGIVIVFCPDVPLYHADGPAFALVILWFAGVYGGVHVYSKSKSKPGGNNDRSREENDAPPAKADDTVDTDEDNAPSNAGDPADPEGVERDLRNGYRTYNVYSCILFGLGGLALAKVALQFGHDWKRNEAASRRLVEEAEALLAIRPMAFDLDAIVEVERAFISFRELLSNVLVQVEPIAFLFLYVMAMALAISATPIKDAYQVGARRLGSIVSVTAVVVLLGISLGSYFLHATVASRELVDALSRMKGWPATDIEHYMRYSEIYGEVKVAGRFSGFFRALLSETVFLVIVVGVAQQAASGARGLMERANR